jgi:hypothetical protein
MTNPLDDLVGRWVGEGSGDYPTIEPFSYREVLEIDAVPGRPLATWRSTTVDGPTGEPRHSEVGFLRRTVDGAELVLAHGFGVTEIAVVTSGGPGEYLAESVSVSCTPTAKTVDAVVRTISVRGDVLEYATSMAAVGIGMTHHLSARLVRS